MYKALTKNLSRGSAMLALQACSGQGVSRGCHKDWPLPQGALEEGEDMLLVPLDHRAWMTTMGNGFAKLLVQT